MTYTHSAETRAKIGAALKGRPGKPWSPESRAKLSAAMRGHAVSPETRAKIAEALKGRPLGFKPGNTANLTHGHTRGPRSPTYKSWDAMIKRCTNPRMQNYPYYGGRGITVCDRWRESFAAFLEDMGERPPGRTLDRIDVNGNYEPGNCRWATPKEQRRNRRLSSPA